MLRQNKAKRNNHPGACSGVVLFNAAPAPGSMLPANPAIRSASARASAEDIKVVDDFDVLTERKKAYL